MKRGQQDNQGKPKENRRGSLFNILSRGESQAASPAASQPPVVPGVKKEAKVKEDKVREDIINIPSDIDVPKNPFFSNGGIKGIMIKKYEQQLAVKHRGEERKGIVDTYAKRKIFTLLTEVEKRLCKKLQQAVATGQSGYSPAYQRSFIAMLECIGTPARFLEYLRSYHEVEVKKNWDAIPGKEWESERGKKIIEAFAAAYKKSFKEVFTEETLKAHNMDKRVANKYSQLITSFDHTKIIKLVSTYCEGGSEQELELLYERLFLSPFYTVSKFFPQAQYPEAQYPGFISLWEDPSKFEGLEHKTVSLSHRDKPGDSKGAAVSMASQVSSPVQVSSSPAPKASLLSGEESSVQGVELPRAVPGAGSSAIALESQEIGEEEEEEGPTLAEMMDIINDDPVRVPLPARPREEMQGEVSWVDYLEERGGAKPEEKKEAGEEKRKEVTLLPLEQKGIIVSGREQYVPRYVDDEENLEWRNTLFYSTTAEHTERFPRRIARERVVPGDELSRLDTNIGQLPRFKLLARREEIVEELHYFIRYWAHKHGQYPKIQTSLQALCGEEKVYQADEYKEHFYRLFTPSRSGGAVFNETDIDSLYFGVLLFRLSQVGAEITLLESKSPTQRRTSAKNMYKIGDVLFSRSTDIILNAVKQVCTQFQDDFNIHADVIRGYINALKITCGAIQEVSADSVYLRVDPLSDKPKKPYEREPGTCTLPFIQGSLFNNMLAHYPYFKRMLKVCNILEKQKAICVGNAPAQLQLPGVIRRMGTVTRGMDEGKENASGTNPERGAARSRGLSVAGGSFRGALEGLFNCDEWDVLAERIDQLLGLAKRVRNSLWGQLEKDINKGIQQLIALSSKEKKEQQEFRTAMQDAGHARVEVLLKKDIRLEGEGDPYVEAINTVICREPFDPEMMQVLLREGWHFPANIRSMPSDRMPLFVAAREMKNPEQCARAIEILRDCGADTSPFGRGDNLWEIVERRPEVAQVLAVSDEKRMKDKREEVAHIEQFKRQHQQKAKAIEEGKMPAEELLAELMTVVQEGDEEKIAIYSPFVSARIFGVYGGKIPNEVLEKNKIEDKVFKCISITLQAINQQNCYMMALGLLRKIEGIVQEGDAGYKKKREVLKSAIEGFLEKNEGNTEQLKRLILYIGRKIDYTRYIHDANTLFAEERIKICEENQCTEVLFEQLRIEGKNIVDVAINMIIAMDIHNKNPEEYFAITSENTELALGQWLCNVAEEALPPLQEVAEERKDLAPLVHYVTGHARTLSGKMRVLLRSKLEQKQNHGDLGLLHRYCQVHEQHHYLVREEQNGEEAEYVPTMVINQWLPQGEGEEGDVYEKRMDGYNRIMVQEECYTAVIHDEEKKAQEVIGSPRFNPAWLKEVLYSCDRENYTLLHLATVRRQPGLLQTILNKAGTSEDKTTLINALDVDQRSPLMLAARFPYDEGIVGSLLSCPGINLNLVDVDGDTTILIAAYKACFIAEKSLKAAAKAKEVGNHAEAEALKTKSIEESKGYWDTVLRLARCPGIDLECARRGTKEKEGDTVLSLARKCGREDIVEQLKGRIKEQVQESKREDNERIRPSKKIRGIQDIRMKRCEAKLALEMEGRDTGRVLAAYRKRPIWELLAELEDRLCEKLFLMLEPEDQRQAPLHPVSFLQFWREKYGMQVEGLWDSEDGYAVIVNFGRAYQTSFQEVFTPERIGIADAAAKDAYGEALLKFNFRDLRHFREYCQEGGERRYQKWLLAPLRAVSFYRPEDLATTRAYQKALVEWGDPRDVNSLKAQMEQLGQQASASPSASPSTPADGPSQRQWHHRRGASVPLPSPLPSSLLSSSSFSLLPFNGQDVPAPAVGEEPSSSRERQRPLTILGGRQGGSPQGQGEQKTWEERTKKKPQSPGTKPGDSSSSSQGASQKKADSPTFEMIP